jgi:hypothetical protein
VNELVDPELITVVTSGTGAFTPVHPVGRLLAPAINDFVRVESKNHVVYRPGLGIAFRFTAVFPDVTTGIKALAGCGTEESGFYFGYNDTGDTFGTLLRTDGTAHIQTFTITAAAIGVETATVTLDGTGFNLPLTNAGGSLNFTAFELGQDPVVGDWNVQVEGDTLFFQAQRAGVRNGVYSFSSTGAATATTATVSAGVALTETFVAEADWNGIDVAHTYKGLGNVFEISYQWLGYGAIFFKVENQSTGLMEIVHTIRFADSSVSPSVTQPNLHSQYILEHLSGTSTPVFQFGSSGGFLDGLEQFNGPLYAFSNTKVNIAASTETSIMALCVVNQINGFPNDNEVVLVSASISTDSNRPVTFRVRLNPVIGARSPTSTADFPVWSPVNTFSMMMSDTTAITASGGEEILDVALPKAGNELIQVQSLKILLQRGDIIAITAETGNATNEVSAAITWREERT